MFTLTVAPFPTVSICCLCHSIFRTCINILVLFSFSIFCSMVSLPISLLQVHDKHSDHSGLIARSFHSKKYKETKPGPSRRQKLNSFSGITPIPPPPTHLYKITVTFPAPFAVLRFLNPRINQGRVVTHKRQNSLALFTCQFHGCTTLAKKNGHLDYA